ncbi:hypothetical protein CVT24_012977 [Panaeolus cyanescens]|uniref:F-box domain-containing protein n=1 Tax=Panaeolus cyanescens TaxID=181874 RepID=A0A409WQZ9_9AGAR|nr:hypothetical protein CVT24_012977 [Panaeolus cyanescens]
MLEDETEFGLDHIDHRRVSWPEDLLSVSFDFPKSLQHLLTHNNPPSSQESTDLNAFKRKTESRYQDNEERIRLLEEELERSKSQKQRLQKQMFACNVAQAPFRRLASDVLGHIAQKLPRFYYEFTSNTPTIHIPLTLSHVSSIWRTTVFRMSTLWQDIQLVRAKTSIAFFSKDDSHNKDQVEHFARLSGTLPLRVELHTSYAYDEPSNGITDFLDWMANYCAKNNKRLKSLHIQLQLGRTRITKSFTDSLALVKNSDALGLQSCVLIYNDHAWNSEIDITVILERNPDLRNIWFGDPSDSGGSAKFLSIVSTCAIHVNPAWAKLVTLCVSSALRHREVANLQWIAKLCPNLESVLLTVDLGSLRSQTVPDVASFKPIVVHHRLKKICLELLIYDCGVLAAFEGCAFPEVTSFQLHIMSHEMSEDAAVPHKNLLSMLTSAVIFPSLRNFTLMGLYPRIDFDPERVLTYLNDVLHTISEFTIFFEYRCPFVVEFLYFMSKPSCPFSNLRKLHLRVASSAFLRTDDSFHPEWPSLAEFRAALQKLQAARPSMSITLHCLVDCDPFSDTRMLAYFREAEKVPFYFPESLYHLLAHNNPPSSQEFVELKAFKQHVQLKCQENEERIRLLEDEIERLKAENKRIQKQIFACNVVQV